MASRKLYKFPCHRCGTVGRAYASSRAAARRFLEEHGRRDADGWLCYACARTRRGVAEVADPWLPAAPLRAYLGREVAEGRHHLPDGRRVTTRHAMAEFLGVHQKQMERWMKSNRWVKLSTVDQVLNKLGSFWHDLYIEDDFIHPNEARKQPRESHEQQAV